MAGKNRKYKKYKNLNKDLDLTNKKADSSISNNKNQDSFFTEKSAENNKIVFKNKGIMLSIWAKTYLLIIFTVITAIYVINAQDTGTNFQIFFLLITIVIFILWIFVDNNYSVNYIMDLSNNLLLKETLYFNKYKRVKKITELNQIKLLGISSTINCDVSSSKWIIKYQTIAIYGNKNKMQILEEREAYKSELRDMNNQLESIAEKINCPNIIPCDGDSSFTLNNKNSSLPIMDLIKFNSTEREIREAKSPTHIIKLFLYWFIVINVVFYGIGALLLYLTRD